jgi:hypothetical protein
MIRKLTRRQLAAAMAAPLTLAGTAAAPQPAADDLQAAKQKIRQDGEKIARYPLAASIEPALHFKA